MFVERTWKVTAAEVKLGDTPQTPRARHCRFRTSLFHITHDFYDYDLMPCGATEQHSSRHAHAFRWLKCCVGPEGNVCPGQAFGPEFRSALLQSHDVQ